MPREKPKNDHEALLQLWNCILGTNGDGLVDKVAEIAKEKKWNMSTTMMAIVLVLNLTVLMIKMFGE